jgi:dolichol-phosphate mannosyltransferase
MGLKTSVILPTYNEREAIVPLISEIQRVLKNENIPHEIVVVDDNSPDGTHALVSSHFDGDETVVPILRTNQKGLATAILHGIRCATGDKIVVMDTDFNHPPALIPLLVRITDFFDIASGSRYVIGGGMETSRFRYIGSKLFNKFIHYTLGVKTTDNLSGFFAFNKEIMKDLDADSIFFGYGDYFIRFLYIMQKNKRFILEVPVVYKDRQGGLSKTNLKNELLRYSGSVLKIRFKGLKSK